MQAPSIKTPSMHAPNHSHSPKSEAKTSNLRIKREETRIKTHISQGLSQPDT